MCIRDSSYNTAQTSTKTHFFLQFIHNMKKYINHIAEVIATKTTMEAKLVIRNQYNQEVSNL